MKNGLFNKIFAVLKYVLLGFFTIIGYTLLVPLVIVFYVGWFLVALVVGLFVFILFVGVPIGIIAFIIVFVLQLMNVI
jgi:hypothetical protein